MAVLDIKPHPAGCKARSLTACTHLGALPGWVEKNSTPQPRPSINHLLRFYNSLLFQWGLHTVTSFPKAQFGKGVGE